MSYGKDELATTVYNQEYFSGAQVAVYMGDIWVDEVSSIQIQVTHPKTPIYGYASTLYDGIADGPVIVRGSFSINFKESGYLFLATETYKKRMQKPGSKFGPYDSRGAKQANLETMINNMDLKSSPAGWEYRAYQDLAGYASESEATVRSKRVPVSTARFPSVKNFGNEPVATTETIGIDKFENLAEAFEDKLWKNKRNGVRVDDISENLRNVCDIDSDGFDLYIMFGDYSNDYANHTMRRITDVHLIGNSLVVAPNGEPIQEVYSFLARNYI